MLPRSSENALAMTSWLYFLTDHVVTSELSTLLLLFQEECTTESATLPALRILRQNLARSFMFVEIEDSDSYVSHVDYVVAVYICIGVPVGPARFRIKQQYHVATSLILTKPSRMPTSYTASGSPRTLFRKSY